MSEKEVVDALNEIRFLASFRHENIVGYYDSFLDASDSTLCIIIEYCGGGDLRKVIERYRDRKVGFPPFSPHCVTIR